MLALLKYYMHHKPLFSISNHCPTYDSHVNYIVAFYATVARISEQKCDKQCLNAASETDFQLINVPTALCLNRNLIYLCLNHI